MVRNYNYLKKSVWLNINLQENYKIEEQNIRDLPRILWALTKKQQNTQKTL